MTSPPTEKRSPTEPKGKAAPKRAKRSARPARTEDFSAAGMQRTLEQVEQELHSRYPQADLSPIASSFAFAAEAHGDQKRVSGEPYVSHPLAVARILAELGLDPVAVTAAFLHDVPEDTEYSLGDVEERFGADVARLVDGVTNLGKFSTLNAEQQQAENIR